jgi:hypothetical protein
VAPQIEADHDGVVEVRDQPFHDSLHPIGRHIGLIVGVAGG